MSKPVLITDCDNVLVHWIANLPMYLQSMGMPHAHLIDCLSGNQMALPSTIFKHLTYPDADKALLDYNLSDYIAHLPIMEPGAQRVLQELSVSFDIIVITNLSDSDRGRRLRTDNLTAVYGKGVFSDIICLDPHSDKTSTIATICETRDVAIWVDDCVHHIKEGLRAGADSFQYTYNMSCGRNTGEVNEMGSWHDIKRYLYHKYQIADSRKISNL